MSDSNKTYTYHCGEKVEREKNTGEIVIRALPAALDGASIVGTEQVSSASTKIKVTNTELEGLMNRNRTSAPTLHGYYETESGSEFLITDCIFMTFKSSSTDAQVEELTLLFNSGGLALNLISVSPLSGLATASIKINDKKPHSLGQKITQSVYRGIGRE